MIRLEVSWLKASRFQDTDAKNGTASPPTRPTVPETWVPEAASSMTEYEQATWADSPGPRLPERIWHPLEVLTEFTPMPPAPLKTRVPDPLRLIAIDSLFVSSNVHFSVVPEPLQVAEFAVAWTAPEEEVVVVSEVIVDPPGPMINEGFARTTLPATIMTAARSTAA